MKRLHSSKGAALVELAIVVPLLLMMIGAIVDFGFLFHAVQVTTNASREGARLAALPGNEQNDYATVRSLVNGYVTSSGLPGSCTITVVPEAIPLGALTANGVRVTVEYTYHFAFLGPAVALINGTFGDALVYRTSSLMRVQVAAAGA